MRARVQSTEDGEGGFTFCYAQVNLRTYIFSAALNTINRVMRQH